MAALDSYDMAISLARENEYIQEEALSNELAARFCLGKNKEAFARIYMKEAHRCYESWGAVRKVQDLKERYGYLLQFPPQVDKADNTPEQLDLSTLMKASHAISGEIEMDKLLSQVMQVVIENVGAVSGFLLIEHEGIWQIRAKGGTGAAELQISIPVSMEESDVVAQSVVRFVARTKERVVIEDAANNGEFMHDPYIRRQKTRSLLCEPLLSIGKLIGILYLENNLVAGAFTAKHRLTLEVLATQTAISLETSGLYETLQESENRLRSVLDVAKIVAWETNAANGKIFEAGPVGKLFGRGEEFAHPDVADLADSIHPEDRDRVIGNIDRALRGEGDYDVEFRVPLADGSVRWIAANGGLPSKFENKPVRLLGIARDITRQKQAEDEIRRLNQELEQRVKERTAQFEAANKELEAFAYSVSHDLRAPLRHISGFMKLLQQKTAAGLDGKSQHYIKIILDAANRMGMLIDNLLSFSRLGRQEPSKSDVNLQLLIEEIVHELEPEAKDRTINWHIGELPVVSGDNTLIRAVFANLISNAIKFTRPCEIGEIEIGHRDEQTESVFYVRDNGVGFNMEYADKLFGVFQRLHRMEEFEGTGIGLANVRRIITRHGGRTWAEGALDKGATFYFSLPHARQDVFKLHQA
jgi:PAS domain S-box-containing protein